MAASITGIVRVTSNSIEVTVAGTGATQAYVLSASSLLSAVNTYGTDAQKGVFKASRLYKLLQVGKDTLNESAAFSAQNFEITSFQSVTGTPRTNSFRYDVLLSGGLYYPYIVGSLTNTSTFTVRVYAPPSIVA
jgi:hypothetical protein